MTYQEARPAPALRPFVQSVWTLTGTEAEPGFELILPDGHAEIIIHRGDSFRQRLSLGRLRVQGAAMIAGQMESGVAVAPGRAVETIGVTFAPCGLAPLCDVPQHTLTGHAPREFVRERLDELTRAFVAVQPPGRHQPAPGRH